MATEKAAAQVAVEFVTEYTKIWLHRDGRVKAGEVIQPKLNARGLEELEKYRKASKDSEALEFPVHVGFPWFKGGLEQYIKPEALTAFKAEWAEKVTKRTEGKMDLDISGDFVGNSRIRINRIMTPKAYELFCEPFPTSTGKAKAGKKAEAPTTSL